MMLLALHLLAALLAPVDIIDEAARDHGVDRHVLRALLTVESGLRNVSGPRGAGVAQLTPAGVAGLNWIRGGRRPFAMADARDPSLAIPAAAELLSWWSRRFGSVEAGLAGYHRGGAAARAVRDGAPHYYPRKVMAVAARLRREAAP